MAYDTVWNTFKIGAGGLIVGTDMAADGTFVCRADTYGCYLLDRTTKIWQQLVTNSSMGGVYVNAPFSDDGVYDIKIAPSNTNYFYMVYGGYCWVSSNQGTNWTQTGFAQMHLGANGQDGSQPSRLTQNKLAIDPANKDVVYLCTLGGTGSTGAGSVFTTSGGSTSGAWTAVSGLAAPDANNYNCAAFDSSSGTTGGKTNTIYIAISGTGLYKSTNAGTSFSLVTGTPTNIQQMRCHIDGAVYVVTADGFLKRLIGTTWTDVSPNSPGWQAGWAQNLACHPTDATQLICFAGTSGVSATTVNTTPSWSTINYGSGSSFSDTDVPWLVTVGASTYATNWPSTTCPVWDTLDHTKVWMGAAQGVFNFTLPFTTSPTAQVLTSVSAGIEQLVTYQVVVPPGKAPITFSGDVGAIRNPNYDTLYATAQNWYTGSFLDQGCGGDYSKVDPNFVCGIFNHEGPEASGYSTDSGITWQKFAGYPTIDRPGGSIACATSSNMVWVQSNRGDLYVTNDGGATWTRPASFTSAPSPVSQQAYGSGTVSGNYSPGATAITFVNASFVHAGDTLYFNGIGYGLSSIVGNVVNLSSGLTASVSTGSTAYTDVVYTVGNYISGNTVITLTGVGGIVPGVTITFGPYWSGTVTSVNSANNTVTLSGTGLNTSVPTDTQAYVETGWGFIAFAQRKCVTVDDTVNGSGHYTFYATNAGSDGNGTSTAQGAGLWVSTDGGVTWALKPSTNIDKGWSTALLKAVPGNPGHLLFVNGPNGSGVSASQWPHTSQLLYYSTDGGTTFNDISNMSAVGGTNQFTIRDVMHFALGKAAPGQSYPAIYIYGWVNPGTSPSAAGSAPGFYRSIDQAKTWVQIGDQYANGWVATPYNMEASKDVYGTVFVGQGGCGYIYGHLVSNVPHRGGKKLGKF